MEPPPVKKLGEYSGWAPTTIPEGNANHCGCAPLDISRNNQNHCGCAHVAACGNSQNHSGSASVSILENNPSKPRWLLDTVDWKVCWYTDVEAEVHKNGYGIISYTWGRWANWDKEPKNPPEELKWKLPAIEKNDKDFLTVARSAVSRMCIRYVWWDWMCVPQGKNLSPELEKVQGEEINKQMAIYAGANKSIVWLHCTDWRKQSPVRSLLANKIPKDSLEKFMQSVDELLSDLRHNEPWLTSGWTLQEGVLLSETVLLDHDGHTLPHPQFLHNDGKASVLDLTAGITTFAIRIASAFMKVSEANDSGEFDEVVKYIKTSEKHYERIACFLSRLLHSGLIAYTKNSPLFILAGKNSRYFSVEHDKCWALLGALGLGNITPPPNYDLEMDAVKTIFFGHLLIKHQWTLLLVAGHSGDDDHLSPHHWHTRFADGKYLPLGIFFDIHWRPNLPYLSWLGTTDEKEKDAIHMQSQNGLQFAVLKVRDGSPLGREYEQRHTADGFPYIHIYPIERLPPSPMLYFPIADLQGRWNKPGMRCIQIQPIPRVVKDPATGEYIEVHSKIGSLEGYFSGVIDIWAAEGELDKDQHLHKLTLFSPG